MGTLTRAGNDAMLELTAILARHATDDVTLTPVPGLTLYRVSRVQSSGLPLMYRPMVFVMAQGEKHVALGDRILRYSANDYLLSSLHLPVNGTIVRSSEKNPYLSFSPAMEPVALQRWFSTCHPNRRSADPCARSRSAGSTQHFMTPASALSACWTNQR